MHDAKPGFACRIIYCCGCASDVSARLTNGSEIYPHRSDLVDKRFWRCDTCLNYVGVHPGGNVPLGCIPNAAIRNARNRIHEILDPIWKQKRLERRHLYARLSKVLGRQYHTGELRTLEEVRMIYKAVREIERELAA